jgi:hypothetical protein
MTMDDKLLLVYIAGVFIIAYSTVNTDDKERLLKLFSEECEVFSCWISVIFMASDVLGWAGLKSPGFCGLLWAWAYGDAEPSPVGGLGLGWAWLGLGRGLAI